MKTLRTQILLGFGVVLLLVGILAVNSILSINGFVKSSEEMSEEQLPMLITDSRLAFNVAERVAISRGYMLTGEERYVEEFNELTEASITLQEELERMAPTEEVSNLITKSIEWRAVLTDQLFPAVKAGNNAEASRIDDEIAEPLSVELISGFDDLASARQDSMLASEIDNAKAGSTTSLLILF